MKKFACAAVALFVVAGLLQAADENKKDKGKGGKRPSLGKVTKVEGDKVTVAVRKRGAKEPEVKTYTLTKDTKYAERAKGEKKDLTADEAKSKLKEGAILAITADESGNATSVVFGGGRRPRPKKDSK